MLALVTAAGRCSGRHAGAPALIRTMCSTMPSDPTMQRVPQVQVFPDQAGRSVAQKELFPTQHDALPRVADHGFLYFTSPEELAGRNPMVAKALSTRTATLHDMRRFRKHQLINKFKTHRFDTGSSRVQGTSSLNSPYTCHCPHTSHPAHHSGLAHRPHRGHDRPPGSQPTGQQGQAHPAKPRRASATDHAVHATPRLCKLPCHHQGAQPQGSAHEAQQVHSQAPPKRSPQIPPRPPRTHQEPIRPRPQGPLTPSHTNAHNNASLATVGNTPLSSTGWGTVLHPPCEACRRAGCRAGRLTRGAVHNR